MELTKFTRGIQHQTWTEQRIIKLKDRAFEITKAEKKKKKKKKN